MQLSESPWTERWDLLRSKGGLSAAVYWLVRALVRVDLFKVLTTQLHAVDPSPAAAEFIQVRNADELEACETRMVDALEARSGFGIAALVAAGGRIYALVDASGPLCQLTIDTRRSRVDTPCELTIELNPGDCFLSYLYTDLRARRGGWAKRLLAITCGSLAQEGFQRCHCHVQATNLRSLNTFSAMNWRWTGVLAATPRRRYLGCLLQRSAPLRVIPGRS